MEIRQHSLLEAKKPCLRRGFLLSIFLATFGLVVGFAVLSLFHPNFD